MKTDFWAKLYTRALLGSLLPTFLLSPRSPPYLWFHLSVCTAIVCAIEMVQKQTCPVLLSQKILKVEMIH